MLYTIEQARQITEQMHKHFEEVIQAKFWMDDKIQLDFTRDESGTGYQDDDVNLMWAGYQSSTQNVVWDKFKVRYHLEFHTDLLTRYGGTP